MTEIRDPRRAAALVAMGIIVPGADTPQMLWDNVINNRTFFRQAQASDFGADPAGFLQTGEPAQDKAYSLSGSWTPDRKFDFEHLALPKSFDPDEADASLNHWLYAVMEALSGANLKGHDPSKIGVIAGHVILPTRAMSEATVSLYGREATRDWEFNPFRPPPHTNPFRAVGYSAKLASETFGFTGPSFTVDAACASSLYAVKLALNHLRDSSLTAVVTGGLAKADPLFTQLGFSQLRALSHSGVCRPFSPDSDGLVVGSGAVALLLKRLDRAIEDKDDVICVISGVGLSNDRSGNLLAPDPEGQKRAMDNAFRDACLPDDQAPGLFEAHGTSTPLGDAKEVSAIKDFLTSRRCSFPPVIGSVKGNVGHLLSAAGAASLAKTALAVSKGVLPPTAGITGNKTAPNLELDKHPILEILPKAKPWPKGSARIAAVNAFGFGGVNAQAVLEEFVVENWAIEGSAAGGKKSVGAAVKKLSAKTEAKQTSKISSKNSKAGGKRAANAPDAPNSPQASPVSLKSPTDSLKAPADLLKEPAGSLKAPTDRSLDEATVSKDASGLQDISQKDISQQNTSQQDSSQKDAPQREASQQNNSQKDASRQDSPNSVRAFLISARTVLAPWPNYDSLARYWLTPEEPPLASTRRLGSLKATGYFFDNLTIDVKKFHLPPKELADALPQQTLALKAAVSALTAAGIDPDNWPEGLDRDRFGVFMGVDIDPRSSDYALRWLAPPRATDALLEKNLISPQQRENFIATIRKGSPAPLTHDRVLGALGSFVASRLSRFLGAGGPAFTLSEEKDSGLRALHEAMSFLAQDLVDIAVVGVVDTFGDPKTAALAPKTVWVEGAAALVLASPKVASVLKPLAALTLTDQHSRLGPLSGIFSLNRSAFYLRHHLKPLGRGRGFAYWLRNPGDPPRSLSGPSYEIHEHIDTKPHSLTAPSDPIRPDVWFFLKAVDQNDLKDKLVELSLFAEGNSSKDLYVLSREFWNQQLSKPGKPQLALLARDNRELLSHIKRSIAGEIDRDFKPRILQAPSEPIRGDLAFVFPGQTNYYKGLGRSLGASFPDVMHKLETECRNPIGFFQNHLIGETPFRRPSTKEVILSHVSFGLIGSTLLKRFSLKPQAVLSYSLGEMAALIATGIWPDRDEFCRDLLESELFTSELVGELTCPKTFWNWPRHKHVKWITGTIQKPAELVRHAIDSLPPPHRQRVFILLINSHSEVDVGGEESAVQALTQSLEAPFYQIEDVPSFHSPILKAVEDKFRKFVSRETLEQKDLRFYSPYHAKVIDQTSDAVADSLTLQSIHGHDFPKSIEQAYQDGIRFFIEIGPGNATSRMIKNILADKPHVAQSLASTPIDEGWSGLNQVLAELWLSGYPLVLEKLLLFPCLIPDKRFEAPIKLSPPQLSWPIHGETQTKSAESEFAANKLSASDYLMWLEAQTSSLPPQPQAKSPDQAHSGKPAHSGAPAQSGASAQLAEESSLSAPAPPLMPQSDKAAAAAAAAAVAASKIAATQPATKPETKPAAKTRGRAAKSDSILSPPERDFLEGVPSAASASVGGASAESRVVSPKDGAAIQENEKEPSGLSGAGTLQLGRSECLAFAVGSIADVFGKDFKLVDTFPSRVRLPDEPLMFVDRVLEISGEPRSLKQGRIVTQHDLKSGEWCLENGRIIPGMAIESGQADLMLSAYLGIDFVTKGLAHYRLLDAEVVFHDHTPSQGQTATYDISINNFFSHDQTTMFRFEFIGSVGDKPILSMRRGCAGFFTPQALAAGKGLARKAPISGAAQILPEVLDFPGASTAEKLTEQDLSRLRSGDCSVLGEAFKDRFDKPLLLPGGKLTLFDRVPQIEYSGGSFGGGFVRSEADIDPQAWFLTSHFVGDEVMPGTLMYDGCLQTLRVFLLSMGWIGCGESSSWQPTLGLAQKIKCRGQVTPKTKKVAYEIHLKKMDLTENSEPYAVAEAIMFSDGRPIVEVNNLSLCLAGTTAADLAKSWTQKPAGGSPARSSPARGRPRTSSKESAETEKTVKASSKKSVQQAAETGKSPVSVRRQIKAVEFYDKAALTEISSGLLSKAFGPLYARFDDGSFVARLPQAPYDFIDEATVKKGRLGQVAIGAQVEATYNLSRDNEQRLAFLFQSVKSSLDSRQGALPYAALNEIALQPCGFLAAYMGSALSFNVPMHFRNLGGEAVVRGDISPLEGPIATKATLTKASVLGTMAIQHYQFTCSHQGKVVYEGQTHFGFHDIESLTSPDGLKGQTGLKKALIANMSAASPIAYPQGPAWPVGQWRMLDSICRDPKKEGRMWGMVKVDPKAWFFTAHFPNDPVWPGSLGLEAFLQVAKVLAAAIFFADVPLEDLDVKWTTPVKETNHRWLYRGQITPRNSDVTFGIKISWSDAYKKILSFRGLMWVDGLVVYQIEDLTVQCG